MSAWFNCGSVSNQGNKLIDQQYLHYPMDNTESWLLEVSADATVVTNDDLCCQNGECLEGGLSPLMTSASRISSVLRTSTLPTRLLP